MSKASDLSKIASEIENCKECKVGKSGKAVVGEGNPNAKIMFVGEAPGRKEAETGRPFVGRSGQLLRSLIRSVGLAEEDVYITSPVKYLPDRGTPSASDIAHGKIHLDRQIEIIKPKLIVLLGNSAIKAELQDLASPKLREVRKIAVTQMHGRIIERNGRKYFVTFHPAAGLRFPPIKKQIEEDFKKLKNLKED